MRSLKRCILLQSENAMTLRVTDVAYLNKFTQGNVSVNGMWMESGDSFMVVWSRTSFSTYQKG